MELQKIYYIAEIISKYLSGNLIKKEEEELRKWLDASENNRRLLDEFSQYEFIERKQIAEQLCNVKNAYQQFLIRKQYNIRRKKFKQIYKRIAVASVLLTGIAVSFFYNKEDLQLPVIVAKTTIQAGEHRAILTLDDGRKIQLDGKVVNDTIVRKGVTVSTSGSRVVYDNAGLPAEKLSYNQLDVPRKGEFELTLSDGSKVWLNSQSRLKYPVNFIGRERRVYLDGEAYFEVAKNKKMPFFVEMGNTTVKVLGTSFNARAYGDEANVTTTLVKGCVELSMNGKQLILSPDEQGIINTHSGTIEKKPVEVKLFTSWKDGRFIFEGQTLEDIMATLERWYDVNVFFTNEGARKVIFTGNLRRYDSFDKIIEMLEMTQMAHFKINGNTIFISEK